MPFHIINGDIVTFKGDAIVNAANKSLLGGGGVDGAIHKAAGPRLLEECRALGGCETGEAKITKGYNLGSKYVIHTVGPVWKGGIENEEVLLRTCYRNALKLASENKCEKIAFPNISAGAYGYPASEARRIATEEITDFLADNDIDVSFYIYDKTVFLNKKKDDRLEAYIRCNLAENDSFTAFCDKPDAGFVPFETGKKNKLSRKYIINKSEIYGTQNKSLCMDEDLLECKAPEDFRVDDSFVDMLFRKIDEKGITDVQCYKAANIDRKHFSQIRCDRGKKVKKETAVALALALKLTSDEADEFLAKAGYALSDCYLFDVIIKYCFENGIYKVTTVNEILHDYDLKTLN